MNRVHVRFDGEQVRDDPLQLGGTHRDAQSHLAVAETSFWVGELWKAKIWLLKQKVFMYDNKDCHKK